MKRKIHVVIFLAIMICSTLAGCSSNRSTATMTPGSSILPIASKEVTDGTISNGDTIELTGVLTYVDTTGYKMHYVDIQSGSEYEVSYTGGTDIQNKYDSIISARTMQLGDIYHVVCNKAGKAMTIRESSDAWESSGITNLGVDESSMIMTVGSTDYKYTSRTVVLSSASRINVAEILSSDQVTARGVGKTIYSVTVDKGHGYITFTGMDSFLGGYVDIGTFMVYTATSGMVVTAPEGQYSVQLKKGNLMGSKTVVVERGKEITVDFSEFKTEAVKTGAVKFSVTPENAVMYIDGTQVDYTELIQLDYGKHIVVLNANNYQTYTETFTVNASYVTKIIDMTSASTSTIKSSTSATKSSTTTTKSSTTSSTTSSTMQADLALGYTVHIKEPEGAAVYVDSVYVGIAPVSFSKSAGKKVVTFTKSGCATKSYTIEIANATGDLNYSFPDMEESTTTATTE